MAGQGYQVGKGFSVGAALPNPTANPSISTNTTGSLNGTYYIKITWQYPSGESAPYTAPTSSPVSQGILVWSTTFPSGATGMNVYIGTASGLETYQGQQTTPGGSANGVTVSSLAVGKPVPQWNTTTYQDINPSALGLAVGSEFIVHDLYYGSALAFGMWDGTNLVMFDGDTGVGTKMDLSIHCNASQWLRVFNQNTYSTLQVSFDGMQTQ